MKCPYCDSDLEKGKTFCSHCGEDVGKITPKQSEQIAKVRRVFSKIFLVIFVLVILAIGIFIFLGTRG